MNIFVTNKDPLKCAEFLDDKCVIKMILESAQMLSTAATLTGYQNELLYKPTHKNHPCNVWVRESRENYNWLWNHFACLLMQYQIRFDKTHACAKLFNILENAGCFIPSKGPTPFVNCAANKGLGIDFKNEPDVFEAYKKYLTLRWKHDKRKPTWKGKELNE